MQTKKVFSFIGNVIFVTTIGSATMVTSKGKNMTRKVNHTVEDIIINRSSRYAMSGESISDAELNQLLEAARWAQSSYNNQPWRFIYAKRGTKKWDTLFNLMVPFNQSWAKNAAVLMVVVSKNTLDFNNQPSITHSFDAGAACQNMALQGTKQGLVVHGMEGFDYKRAKKDLHIPDGYTVEAMFAIGKPGNIEDLPEELRAREVMSDRKLITDFVFEGEFK